MKNTLIIAAFIFSIFSCTKADIQSKDENGDCLVTINPVGEISTTDNPLTKVSTSNIYMLQVYQNDTSYAVGLFNDLSLMKVYLRKGLSYKIYVSAAYGIKSYLTSSNSTIKYSTPSNPSSYDIELYCKQYLSSSEPNFNNQWNSGVVQTRTNLFMKETSNCASIGLNTIYYSYKPNVIFNYSSTGRFFYFTDISYYEGPNTPATNFYVLYGYVYFRKPRLIELGKAIINGEINPITTLDWFYGGTTFTPTGEYQTLDLNFKRVGYKLKYELSGVTDGEVTVTIKTQSGKVLIQNTTNTETYSGDAIFVPYYDIASVYQNPNNYYENLIVSVSWLRGIGVTQDLGSTTIQVKRNNLNRVRISLGNSDAGAAMNLSTEAESMGAESTDITVE